MNPVTPFIGLSFIVHLLIIAYSKLAELAQKTFIKIQTWRLQ